MTNNLSTRMREMLWDLLACKRNPKGILIIGDERTARALVRRGLLRSNPDGYVLDEKAARRALGQLKIVGKKTVTD